MTHVVTPMAQAETAAGAGVSEAAGAEISEALRQLLADVFALYVKTKSFHWHVRGRHFRDHHLLLDEQAAQIFASRAGLWSLQLPRFVSCWGPIGLRVDYRC